MARIEAAQKRLTDAVISKQGVTGTAIGLKDGKPCLKVYVSGPDVDAKIPRSLGGFPVVVESTGTFRRL